MPNQHPLTCQLAHWPCESGQIEMAFMSPLNPDPLTWGALTNANPCTVLFEPRKKPRIASSSGPNPRLSLGMPVKLVIAVCIDNPFPFVAVRTIFNCALLAACKGLEFGVA